MAPLSALGIGLALAVVSWCVSVYVYERKDL